MKAWFDRHAGGFVAAFLAIDGLVHAYWVTGARWPAEDSRTLSRLVLGANDVPFTPDVVGPLAALLLSGALVVGGHMRWRDGSGLRWLRRALRAGMLAITAGFAMRALLGIAMIALGDPGSTFFWLNLVLYTPLCCVLTAAAIVELRGSRTAPSRA